MIFIGIDPALHATGWGVLHADQNNKPLHIANGTIVTNPAAELPERLFALHHEINAVFMRFNPTQAALEGVFVAKHPLSALKIGYGRGVILALCGGHNICVREYAPNHIKKNITGHGRASKEQMVFMVGRLLNGVPIHSHHAADALALALTCMMDIKNRF